MIVVNKILKGVSDMLEIKGYITNLGKYTEGELVGKWVTFPIDDEEFEQALEEIGINKQYEEYFFTDWDGCYYCCFGEYESIDKLNELAEALENEGEELVKAIMEATGCSLEEALTRTDEAIFYENMTLKEVACEIVNECYNLPEFALQYFDYEAFGRDLRYDGYTEVDNGVILLA
jgi:antirestriction protein